MVFIQPPSVWTRRVHAQRQGVLRGIVLGTACIHRKCSTVATHRQRKPGLLRHMLHLEMLVVDHNPGDISWVMTHGEMLCSGLEHVARHASNGLRTSVLCVGPKARSVSNAVHCHYMRVGCEHLVTGLNTWSAGTSHMASRDGGIHESVDLVSGYSRRPDAWSLPAERRYTACVLQGTHVRVHT